MVEALRAEHLRVLRGQRVVIDDVSLHVEHGTLLAVVGPNGAGKSTLLKALLGLIPHQGSVHLEGASQLQLTAAERARKVAYIPQRSAVMHGISVLDVVAQARYAHRSRFGRTDPDDPAVTSALERCELGDLARRSFDTLSGGEQRRVLLARALATGARTLLFDEPTAGLDVAQVLLFFRLGHLLRAQGHALICVLHELGDVLRHADRALLLAGGRGLGFGPVAEVLNAEQIKKVYGVHSHEHAALGFSLDGHMP